MCVCVYDSECSFSILSVCSFSILSTELSRTHLNVPLVDHRDDVSRAEPRRVRRAGPRHLGHGDLEGDGVQQPVDELQPPALLHGAAPHLLHHIGGPGHGPALDMGPAHLVIIR